MRFFTPILAISAAALSIATTTTTTPASDPSITITSVQFYEPLDPTADDNNSINIGFEVGTTGDECTADWKYGTDQYPKTFTVCANGHFYFYFKSYTSASEWTIEAEYIYTVGTTVKTIKGEATVTAEKLSCESYLNTNRCELSEYYSSGLRMGQPSTT